jgi:hypothetical protein
MILTEACDFAFCRIWRCRLQESLGGSNERLEADDMFDKGLQETTRIVPVLPSGDLERVAQDSDGPGTGECLIQIECPGTVVSKK